MKFFLFLLIIFVIEFEADAIEITCDYTVNFPHHRNHPYACTVTSVRLLSSDDCELTSVTGHHKPGKSNDDVTLFFSSGRTFNCFPKITNFFKNTDGVVIYGANIATIDKSNLQQFGSKLTYLHLASNKLEVIDSDLFEYTPNVEIFYVHSNHIKYVASGAFGKLQKLSYLYFTSNPCHSDYAGDRAAVINLISNIERNCNDVQALERHRKLYTTTTEAPTTTTTARNYDEELKIQIAKLNEEHNQKFDKLNEEAAKSKAEIDNLKAENAKLFLEADVKKHNEALNETKMEIIKKLIELEAKLEAKINNIDSKINSKLDRSEAKLDSVMKSVEESKVSTLKDLILENFTSLNATCSASDYKLDLLNRDCITRPCHRQP